jgi:hypothetical protein
MIDNINWYRRRDGLDLFVLWLEARREDTYVWDNCEECSVGSR